MKSVKVHTTNCFYVLFLICLLAVKSEHVRKELDDVIEDVITKRLAVDLVQSIEKKFSTDLAKAVDMVNVKIKLLLQNGTLHIHDKVVDLQSMMDAMKNYSSSDVERCLKERESAVTTMVEKALHQMVICGYALIGHDPASAIKAVGKLKDMIKQGMKPIAENEKELYDLLKLCGHDHDTLKKVIKCVISKSPIVKSAMMDVTGQLIDGVVSLTKVMAHGAMHEACLIEVVKTVEDEAFDMLENVRVCVYGVNDVSENVKTYLRENNATVLDFPKDVDTDKDEAEKNTNEKNLDDTKGDKGSKVEKKNMIEMKNLLRRMLEKNGHGLKKSLQKKMIKLQKELGSDDVNTLVNKNK